LFTIRGDSADEFVKHLTEMALVPGISKLLHILDGVQAVQAVAPQAVVVEQTTPTGIPQQQTFAPVPPPSVASTTGTSAPTCSHGTKTAKKGNGAKGEWRAWMCPAPKGTADQCQPAWVTRGTADWANFPA
jgi:hypothetical protein